jgi:predicted HTH domain antitoxin
MTVTINISEQLSEVLHESNTSEERALLLEAVCGLYSRGRIGGGEAAAMLALSRTEFWHELAVRRIPRQYSTEMLEEDLAFARSH